MLGMAWGVATVALLLAYGAGFGNAINVRRTVESIIRAGAAMLFMEDQVAPKRCGHLPGSRPVVSMEEHVGKIEAAIVARRDPDFVIKSRTDVLEDRLVPLDQMSHLPKRWPQGNIWYLYGSRFLSWITDTYGYQVIPQISADTSDELIPYAINRYVRRATGRTYEELYEGWTQWMRKHYTEQLAPVQARGLREGSWHAESWGLGHEVPGEAGSALRVGRIQGPYEETTGLSQLTIRFFCGGC